MFGLQLFIRHHAQGLSLTPAGRQFLVEARGLLSHASDLRQSAIGLGDKLAGEIDIGCFITFAPLLIPGLLRGFAQRYPETRIRLHEDHTQALLDGLRAGRFDLALTYDLNLGPDLRFDALAEVPLHVILPVGHRLARRPAVSLAELIEEPLVLLALPHSRDYFLSVFYSLRLQPRIGHETPSFEMVRGLVANGHGYSVMHSRPASDMSLDGMQLVYRPITERPRPTKLGIARLHQARPRRMASAFAEFCGEYLQAGGLALAPLGKSGPRRTKAGKPAKSS